MKLLEYQAKELFAKYGLPVKKGCVVDTLATIPEKIKAAGLSYPVVIKAQVQIGGRGKAGGIQFAESETEAIARAQELLNRDIRGLTAKELLIVEKAEITTGMVPVHLAGQGFQVAHDYLFGQGWHGNRRNRQGKPRSHRQGDSKPVFWALRTTTSTICWM